MTRSVRILSSCVFVVAVLLAEACSSSTDEGSHVPSVGRYNYSFSYPGGPQYSGTLLLTYAAADSIAGTWQVPGYRSDAALGFYNVDAYVLYAYPTTGNTITHRFKFARGDASCEAGYIYLTSGGGIGRLEGPCAVSYLGP